MTKTTPGLLAALVAALLTATTARAASPDPTAGDIVLLPGPLAPLESPDGKPQSSPMGWNIPGRHFKSGTGWWVLACTKECTLTASRLEVTRATHPDYDGPPLPSQFLQWTPMPHDLAVPPDPATGAVTPTNATLLAIFKPVRTLADLRLREGPIKTWLHGGMKRYPQPKGEGTMETLIRMEGGETATLLPRLHRPAPADAGATANPDSAGEVFFELRAKGLRQQFENFSFDMGDAHPLTGRDYLLWAGDLDGDGKLDLLLRFAERGWNTVLYLSSLAGPGQLVGEAGRFSYFDPSDPGC